MKKLITLIAAIIGLSLLGWYAYSLSSSQGVSSSELIAFSIDKIETVDKVIISDSYGQEITLIKNGYY